MAMLDHPGIVKVLLERGEENGAAYFGMEYLPGRDLRERVLAGTWDRAQATPLILAVAEALRYAHSRGLIHRDIKPANVLLTEAGAPKLTDFDLVHATDTTGGTRTGAMGTFFYAAPEAMHDAGRVDARADLYSLGKVWTFMLYGRELPPEAFANSDAFIGELGCDASTKRVLCQLCAWDRERRPASVSALLDELARPHEISPPSVPARAPERAIAPGALKLRFISGQHSGQEIWIDDGASVVVGRDAGADIVLAEPTISRRHCRFTRLGDLIEVQDWSSNGLFINGQKLVGVRRLKAGDVILLGSNRLQLVEDVATGPRFEPSLPEPAIDGMGAELDAAIKGRLDEFAVNDVLRMLALSKGSGELRLRAPRSAGRVQLQHGNIVSAYLEHLPAASANKALGRMLTWRRGSFRFDNGRDAIASEGALLSLAVAAERNERVRAALEQIRCDSPAARLQLRRTSPEDISADERALLSAIFAYRNVQTVLDHCPLEDMQIVALIATLLERDLVALES